MGYNCEHAPAGAPLCFDIETVGDLTAVALLGPVKPAANLRDPVKIAASIAEREQARIDKAALDCDTARIVCIGVSGPAGAVECCGPDEADHLRNWWTIVREHQAEFPTAPLVGFNCLAFDLPVLIRRSQILGISYPSLPVARYRHEGVVDLMQVLTFDGLVEPKALAVYCRLFGLDVPADATTGADIAALVAAEDWTAVADHCQADVAKTAALAARLGVR